MNPFKKQETAYLLGIQVFPQKRYEALESLEELRSLSKTAGVKIAGSQLVEVRQIQPGTFIGKGKISELEQLVKTLCVDLLILDIDLNPSQIRNLETTLKVRVIDRTNIILDIFALHASSKEGKLQVELAQYEYLYPRLAGAWSHLSRQRGGGVGLRGPGETQLEVDRRRVRERMGGLRESLRRVELSRDLHRKKRQSVPLPTITLVGYTNAGKSTLFNQITKEVQLAEDKLFATLDPKTARIKLPSGREVLFSDTVGFIRNLPHMLVEAFKSTFEEVRHSGLLIHVVDGSQETFKHQMEVVETTLTELGLGEIPQLIVFNKADSEEFPARAYSIPSLRISAQKGEGISDVLHEIERLLSAPLSSVKLFLPHPYGAQLAELYKHGHIYETKNSARGVSVKVALPEKWQRKYEAFLAA